MQKPSPVITISISSDFKDEFSTPSPLAKHYHLSPMISILQKKFLPELKDLDINEAVKKFEELFYTEDLALEHDIAAIEAIAYATMDTDEKVKTLTVWYEKVHSRSQNRVIIFISKLVFANEQWFADNEEEAKKLFPIQEAFDQKFFDTRRNLTLLFGRKKQHMG